VPTTPTHFDPTDYASLFGDEPKKPSTLAPAHAPAHAPAAASAGADSAAKRTARPDPPPEMVAIEDAATATTPGAAGPSPILARLDWTLMAALSLALGCSCGGLCDVALMNLPGSGWPIAMLGLVAVPLATTALVDFLFPRRRSRLTMIATASFTGVVGVLVLVLLQLLA
jgi:hypothetical protein